MQHDLTLKVSEGQSTTAGAKDENDDIIGIRIPADEALATKGITAVIADGVSAASAGRDAAETCVQGFLNDYYSTPDSWSVKTSAHKVITSLNRWLYGQTQSAGYLDEKGYVTTLSILILKSRTAYLFHVGDTRISLYRDGKLEQLTRDHSTRISKSSTYLSRAIGLGVNLEVDFHSLAIEEGDLLVLTSDGVHEYVSRAETEAILASEPKGDHLDFFAEALVQKAHQNHSPDNLTCQLVKVDKLPGAERDDIYRQLSSLPFPPDLKPGQKIDGFRVESLLYASKTSQLYVVTDEEGKGERMVMKTPSVNFEDDAAYIERFAMEEWIGSRVKNAHLNKAVRLVRTRKFLYHLQEYIEGRTLQQWIDENNGAPDIPSIISITAGIIEGVRALHRRETLHQDLKLGNIILTKDLSPVIIDYGSCRIAGMQEIEQPFNRQAALGTVDFSAPEYRLDLPASPRSDQFSIAMITYHLLTGGKHPYGSKWESATTAADFHQLTYRPASHSQPLVPTWIDQTLKKALSINADLRYDSLSEFIHDLRHPNPQYLKKQALPLIEKNPVLFWKLLCGILFAIIILLLFRLSS
ncbi:MAG: bifunctional protein-serine/threonine kinase/phosphatase [Verrucomicrobiales bacterium]|nr:bifunctional protein-serine/threonine kinase/phosphatase [Verrucomicrobiales bacterium]